MKKLCGLDKKDLMKWVDGALEGSKATVILAHVEGCASCQQDVEAFRHLNGLLRVPQENIEVSRGFETAFWAKVSERQRLPWLERLLNGLEALVPMPNLRQAVAFATIAFFIGNMGGIVSVFGQEMLNSASSAPSQHSSLQGYKGIAPYSMAGAYLSATKNEVSQ